VDSIAKEAREKRAKAAAQAKRLAKKKEVLQRAQNTAKNDDSELAELSRVKKAPSRSKPKISDGAIKREGTKPISTFSWKSKLGKERSLLAPKTKNYAEFLRLTRDADGINRDGITKKAYAAEKCRLNPNKKFKWTSLLGKQFDGNSNG